MTVALHAPSKGDVITYRAVLAERRARGEASRGDRAYMAYLAVLVILTVAPSGFAATHHLLVQLGFNADPSFAAVVLGVLTVAAVLASRVRGPVASSLSDIDLILSTPMDWAAVHARSGLLWTTASAAIGALVSTALGAFELGFDPAPLGVIALAGAGAGVGLFLWFVGGQWAASVASRAPYALVLTASVAASTAGAFGWGALNPAAWGSVVIGLPAASAPMVLILATLVCALLVSAAMINRAAARGISREYIRVQQWAWSAVKIGTLSANPLMVSEAVLKERNHCRHIQLSAMPDWLHPAVARDLLGAIRRWPRSMSSLLVAAVAAVTISTQPASIAGWILGSTLLTLAARMSSLGLRSHADNLGRSSSLERQTALSLAAHLAVPTVILGLGAVGGLLGSWAGGAAPSLTSFAVLALVAISLLAQGVPAYSTQLPLYLMGPIVTPVGDLSSVAIGGWLMRVYILTLAATWTIYTAAASGSVLQLATWTCAGALIAAAWSWLSLRRERTNNG